MGCASTNERRHELTYMYDYTTGSSALKPGRQAWVELCQSATVSYIIAAMLPMQVPTRDGWGVPGWLCGRARNLGSSWGRHHPTILYSIGTEVGAELPVGRPASGSCR